MAFADKGEASFIERVEGEADLGSQLHVTFTPDAERKVLRKIDLRLIPCLLLSFALQYVDKIILNGAAQFGVIKDLHLYELKTNPVTGQPTQDLHRYSNATLIFYWGYLAGVFPAAALVQRVPLGKLIPGSIVCWGAVVMLTVLVKGYQAFLIQRFFLGVSESLVAPAFTIITAMWWKKSEQPLRLCLWYTSTGLGGLLGSILLFGIGHIQGPLHPWKYQYLILGAMTVIWGVSLFWLLPDSPVEASFLDQTERSIAVKRIERGGVKPEDRAFKLYQIKETVLDPKTWLFLILVFCVNAVNGAISGFGSVIVRGFGYSQFTSILLTGAVGAVVLVALIVIGAVGTFVRNTRLVLLIASEAVVIVGSCLVWKVSWTQNRGAAIGGFMIMGFFAAAYTMVLASSIGNTAGLTKKSFTSGLIWAVYCICNGVAPLWVRTTEQHDQYPTLFIAVISTAAAAIVAALALRLYLQYLNRRRHAQYGDPSIYSLECRADMTDGEDINFRYCL